MTMTMTMTNGMTNGDKVMMHRVLSDQLTKVLSDFRLAQITLGFPCAASLSCAFDSALAACTAALALAIASACVCCFCSETPSTSIPACLNVTIARLTLGSFQHLASMTNASCRETIRHLRISVSCASDTSARPIEPAPRYSPHHSWSVPKSRRCRLA